MKLDFSPVRNEQMTLGDFAKHLTVADLRDMTNESIDTIWRLSPIWMMPM